MIPLRGTYQKAIMAVTYMTLWYTQAESVAAEAKTAEAAARSVAAVCCVACLQRSAEEVMNKSAVQQGPVPAPPSVSQ